MVLKAAGGSYVSRWRCTREVGVTFSTEGAIAANTGATGPAYVTAGAVAMHPQTGAGAILTAGDSAAHLKTGAGATYSTTGAQVQRSLALSVDHAIVRARVFYSGNLSLRGTLKVDSTPS